MEAPVRSVDAFVFIANPLLPEWLAYNAAVAKRLRERRIQPRAGHVCAVSAVNDPATKPLETKPCFVHYGCGGRIGGVFERPKTKCVPSLLPSRALASPPALPLRPKSPSPSTRMRS